MINIATDMTDRFGPQTEHVDAGPWKHFRGCYERHISFTCVECRNRHHAVLKVYSDGAGAALITVKIDGRMREMSVDEYTDPFSTALETLFALADTCCNETKEN